MRSSVVPIHPAYCCQNNEPQAPQSSYLGVSVALYSRPRPRFTIFFKLPNFHFSFTDVPNNSWLWTFLCLLCVLLPPYPSPPASLFPIPIPLAVPPAPPEEDTFPQRSPALFWPGHLSSHYPTCPGGDFVSTLRVRVRVLGNLTCSGNVVSGSQYLHSITSAIFLKDFYVHYLLWFL